MSSGKGGSSNTTTTKVQYPDWVNNAAQSNLAKANTVANNLLPPYTGQRVADLSSATLGNFNALQNNVGAANPAFGAAQNYATNVAGFNPSQVQTNFSADQINPNTLASTNLSPYLNPYTQNVIDTSLRDLNIQRQQGLNQIGDQAIRAGAFAGSRQGVAEGVLNAEAARQAGMLSANLNNQNFMQAQTAAQNDIARNLQAQQLNQAAGLQTQQMGLQGQQANQQAGLSGAAVNLQGANSLGNLANQQQQTFLQGLASAQAGQDALQNQQQNLLNAAQQYYTERQQYPLQQLQIPLQALGATPYGSTSSQSVPASSNPFLTGLGAASTGISLLGGLKSLGGLSAIPSLFAFSDRTMKTDIKKVGKDQETGLNLYAYRYKGDPKTYPKIVGPMAQEIEKKYPEQVIEVAGKKAVNLGFGPMRRTLQ